MRLWHGSLLSRLKSPLAILSKKILSRLMSTYGRDTPITARAQQSDYSIQPPSAVH
ncbi:MAG: hypothetical protein NW701_09410 [Nitrospira sp.]